MLTLPNVNPLSCGALSGITMGDVGGEEEWRDDGRQR